jgi:thioredoxin reductase/protein-L-isoaspartate O-methyltransferase
MTNSNYDVVVVGGGVAGLSGALLLARSRRSVLVLDAGEPRNAPAHAAHNFLSRDGVNPHALLEAGQAEVRGYGGHIAEGRVRSAALSGDAFEVTLEDGSIVTARRLLVATGLVDELPNIPGLRERWGRDVLHCPYCHGWEVRDQAVGVLASEPRAVHMALLFRQLTPDVVLFTHTAPALTSEQSEELAARDIRVIGGLVESIEVEDDRLSGVRLQDGTVVARQAVVVTPSFVARSQMLSSLGLQPTPHPMDTGEFISADATGRTAVPGVSVAGNVTDLSAGLMAAAGSGATAAAALNADLVAEDASQAVKARRRSRSGALQAVRHLDDGLDPDALLTQDFWDARYGSAEQIWSGNPNPQLVAQVADLAPGSALDVGCGEGADAIWLAEHGWQVTAIDISSVALERAVKRAREAGHKIAERIDWQQADVVKWDPAPHQFDLVSAQFMHLPRPAREALHRRLAAAVRPGGTLLIVGHHPADLETTVGRPHLPDFLYTPEDVSATLDAAEWEVTAATAPGRQALDPEGRSVTIRDAVVRAVRRTPKPLASSSS